MRNATILLAAVFFLAGCSRTLEQPAGMKKGDTFTWRAQASTGVTKTTLDGTTLSWAAKDIIGVFIGDLQENRMLVYSDGTNFDGSFIYLDESYPSVNYYAYYPYIDSATPSTTVNAVLPSEQTAPFDGSANYMIANVETAKYDEEDMPAVNFRFNNQLMSIVKVTVTNSNDAYSSQELLGVSLVATGGETLAGHFSFDITSPATNPVFSTTPVEVSNSVTATYPSEARPVLGTGTPHSVYVLVNPTSVAALKVIVRTTDNVFVATSSVSTTLTKGNVVSLPTLDLASLTPQRRVRQLVLWGDSITNTGYRTYMQAQLGSDWTVIRGGIGGDSPLGIAGRQGAIPLCLRTGFTIPASNEESVTVGIPHSTKNTSNNPGYSSVGKDNATRYVTDPGGLINPCTIRFHDDVKDVDVEIEGRMTDNGNGWDFTRTTSGEAVSVPINATVETYGAKAYKDADLIVIYMGANGGYKTDDVLAAFYQQMIDYVNPHRAIVVGFHMGHIVFPSGSERTYWTTDYRNTMYTAFGANYLDLKTEGVSDAYNLLVETGVLKQGQSMSDADAEAVGLGYWPQSFASTNNYSDVHFNGYGSKAMAILVKRKMKELGYLDY